MKLAYWMYAGPAHIGTLRVASSFKNVHAIMHAPLGDDYFNVMRSMLERERDFTPVTASVVDRHVLARGSQEKVVENITRKDKEEQPDLILLTPTCTSSILQEDLQNFVNRASLESKSDVILADVNHYRVNELQAADRTLEQIIRFYIEKAKKLNELELTKTQTPSANIIGIFTLGFHNQHDCRELKRLLNDLGIQINLIIPEGGCVKTLKNLPKAWFNIVPYREVGLMTAIFLQKEFNMPYCATTPMGVVETAAFVREVGNIVQSLSFGVVTESLSEHTNTDRGDRASLDSPNDWSEQNPRSNSQNQNEYRLNEASSSPNLLLNNSPIDRAQLDPPKREDKNLEYKGKHENQSSEVRFPQRNLDWTKVNSPNEKKFNVNFENYINEQTRFISQAAWFSRSIDCQNLTGKKAVVFGDATHAACMTKILSREMGLRVSCAGTYCKHDADWFREQVQGFCDEILITDDHTQVGDMIARIEPAAIFGTQMERHIGKRLDIPCGVISAPVHIQNFPLGYRPFLGYEGTNQIADLVYNSFTLGMEDHLLEIFGGHDTKEVITKSLSTDTNLTWETDGLNELRKIPGFVRGKIKRNVEKFARENNITQINVEVMYAAKEAISQ
uniref:Light-independent protochlorophyllide reductase subunit B n=2 Tax=Ignatiaceae TaxID=2682551 RepID=A0A1W6EGN9_9CHLO|nr:ChlB subunit of protochlorophyllide reductase [Pseudocharacium americanum]YP_009367696.1 ChlB subunit of protochlorophyllide reductase [Ignatius tetrasporus]ARK14558.1 ChlB subunit of protochlorophyllide reductase [Pseudocharacium americanum]ARK14647.1 ChlB subunit of protochlorophyllide reductase [Ignatius tetrasporus]